MVNELVGSKLVSLPPEWKNDLEKLGYASCKTMDSFIFPTLSVLNIYIFIYICVQKLVCAIS